MFVGGPVVAFSFQMRTNFLDGLLFYAHGGKGAYIYILLRSGRLSVAYSAQGIYDSLVFTSNQVSLCDGQWHTIGVTKNGLELVINVDSLSLSNGGSNSQMLNLVISSELYIGVQNFIWALTCTITLHLLLYDCQVRSQTVCAKLLLKTRSVKSYGMIILVCYETFDLGRY